MLQRVDDGDTAADGRLEGELAVHLLRQMHDFLAMGRHERLVGRDDVLARLKC